MPLNAAGPLVSVIIPTYKRPDMLARALRSVLAQTYRHIEVIVVDDNPADSSHRSETEKTMLAFRMEPRLTYVKHKINQGGSAARNTGIGLARGEYVTFLDDDDEYAPEKVERQLTCFQTSAVPRLGIVFCGITIVDHRGAFLRSVLNRVRGDAFVYHMKRNLATCQALFIPARVLREVEGFRKLSCAQDYELVLRILAAGYRVDYVDEYLVTVHLHREERISTNETKIAGKREMYRIKSRYFDRLSRKDVRGVRYAYHLLLCRQHLYRRQTGQALRHYLLALGTNPFDVRNLTEGLGLLIPYRLILKGKTVLHRLLRRRDDELRPEDQLPDA